ncbi:methyltransferase-UbiE family protein [Cordyceps fumosorosea ARSEF 2679]|uniref:Methyltransferase-UbiE family protein n=1 Tax=Cordyceps fumosorosea (strain ARSEF 2679) TaxID=1081104 RepID=A0A167ZLJ0_CORFA|nr:methyltransferase-UbiE family protein [Cordyceps fumosorosea ARSEF 2679]OAA67659.1 methyltransferase-UbiE family protein [Cordyceps fumosorosea ARSEF 2679]
MTQAYTNDHSPSVLQTYTWRDAHNSAAYLLPYLRPHMSILDVGCGPGSITIDLARKVPEGHVVGVEHVPDPLDGARSLASSKGVTNIKFQVGDIHNLPFSENTFDVVHAHQVLQHIADPVLAFKEMRRVVKQGGIVAVQESVVSTIYPDSAGLAAWGDLQVRIRQARGNYRKAGLQLHVWAREAGFPVGNMKKSTGSWCFSNPHDREYWGGAMEERARSSGLAMTAVREGFASETELQQMATAWRTWVEDKDGWLGFLHGQILCWK